MFRKWIKLIRTTNNYQKMVTSPPKNNVQEMPAKTNPDTPPQTQTQTRACGGGSDGGGGSGFGGGGSDGGSRSRPLPPPPHHLHHRPPVFASEFEEVCQGYGVPKKTKIQTIPKIPKFQQSPPSVAGMHEF